MRNIIWKWYEHMPDNVSEKDEVKLLWDNEHPMCSCHRCYDRHEHVVVNKQERECATFDIAVAGDKRIVEKVTKYQ